MVGYKEDLIDLLLESEALQFGEFEDEHGEEVPFQLDLSLLADDKYNDQIAEIVGAYMDENGLEARHCSVMLFDSHKRGKDPTRTELEELGDEYGKETRGIINMADVVDQMMQYGAMEPETLNALRLYYHEHGPEGEEDFL